MSTKERQNEFLLLRSKGIPRQMIRRQFLFQSAMVGILSGSVGILGGIGIFHIVKSFFHTFFEINLMFALQLRIGLFSILYNYFVGIGLLLLSSIPSIRFINRKETNQLLRTLGSDYLDVEYDERTLFSPEAKNEITLGDTPFLRKKTKSKGKNNQKRIAKLPKRKRKTTKVYHDQIRKKEKKIRKFGIYLVLFSLIPLFAYFLDVLSQFPFAPDRLVIFVEEKLINVYDYMYIFSVFSPVFLVLGLIRFFVKENPSRFARVTKKLAHPFVKGKDFLISLNMVKQKAYIRFMIICGLFCSLFVFSNISLYSTQAYSIIDSNFDVGADVKIGLNDNDYYQYNYSQAISAEDVRNRDQIIASNTDNQNQTYIEDVITCLELTTYSWREDSRESHFYIDIPKYLDMITEEGKRSAGNKFDQSIEQIQAYYSEVSVNESGILVTKDFEDYYGKTVGDNVTISEYYFDPMFEDLQTVSQEVTVIAVLPFFPGLHQGSQSWYYHSIGIMFNISQFPVISGEFEFNQWNDQESNVGPEEQDIYIWQFLDIEQPYMDNITQVSSLLENMSYDWYDVNYRQYYQKNLFPSDDDQVSDYFDSTVIIFYNLIYLEFFIIGGILALTLALITLGIQRQNKFTNGVYLSRGIGWKGLLKLVLTQISIVFMIALGFGIIGGWVSGFILMQIVQRTSLSYSTVQLPIFGRPWDVVWLIGGIVTLTYMTYLIVFYFETKKNIRDYFPQF
jgi:hypothetical protein